MNDSEVKAAAEKFAHLKQKKRERISEPPKAKKQKIENRNPKEIKWEPEKHLEHLRRNCACIKFQDPCTGKHGFFRGWTLEALMFKVFCIPLCKPRKKGDLPPNGSILTGFAKPELVFTCLIKTFGEIFPQEKERYVDWELYKWSLAYYGKNFENSSPPFSELASARSHLRSFGGTKNPITQNWVHENVFSKTKLSFPVSLFFSESEPTYDEKDLERIQQATEQLLNDPDFVSVSATRKKIEAEDLNSDDECND